MILFYRSFDYEEEFFKECGAVFVDPCGGGGVKCGEGSNVQPIKQAQNSALQISEWRDQALPQINTLRQRGGNFSQPLTQHSLSFFNEAANKGDKIAAFIYAIDLHKIITSIKIERPLWLDPKEAWDKYYSKLNAIAALVNRELSYSKKACYKDVFGAEWLIASVRHWDHKSREANQYFGHIGICQNLPFSCTLINNARHYFMPSLVRPGENLYANLDLLETEIMPWLSKWQHATSCDSVLNSDLHEDEAVLPSREKLQKVANEFITLKEGILGSNLMRPLKEWIDDFSYLRYISYLLHLSGLVELLPEEQKCYAFEEFSPQLKSFWCADDMQDYYNNIKQSYLKWRSNIRSLEAAYSQL
ncbi:hypothetical protein FACS1894113_5670 [Alphaproteobacteria bacterium]|nr:hypothetical protein FACS1894113_5670 [Alphaproteobacteria bacterium]